MDYNEQFSQVPLAVGSARALRFWRISQSGHLRGVTGYLWPSTTVKAECRSSFNPDSPLCWCGNEVPCRRCTGDRRAFSEAVFTMSGSQVFTRAVPVTCGCGIWAYWDYSWPYAAEHAVSGIIEATGKTILGPKGLRTANAKILGLSISHTHPVIIEMIKANYRVPFYATTKELLKAFPPTPAAYTPPQRDTVTGTSGNGYSSGGISITSSAAGSGRSRPDPLPPGTATSWSWLPTKRKKRS